MRATWNLLMGIFAFLLCAEVSPEKNSAIQLTEFKDLASIQKPALVLFIDKFDGQAEKSLIEMEKSLAMSIESESTSSTSSMLDALRAVKLYTLVYRMTAAESLQTQVVRYPLLRYYEDPGLKSPSQYANYDGRLVAKFISNFLKRQISQRERRISASLKDFPHFGQLISMNDPIVLYCGPNIPEYRPEFEAFENLAKTGSYVFYHSLTTNICTQINLMRVDLIRNLSYAEMQDHVLTDQEKEVWVKQRQQELTEKLAKGSIQYANYRDEYTKLVAPETESRRVDKFNSTLWDLYSVTRPVIFIANKANDLFEIFYATANKSELLANIKSRIISNYFTDMEKAHDVVLIDEKEGNFGRHWLALLKSPKDDLFEKVEPCEAIKNASLKYKSSLQHLTFGCFDRTGATLKFGLDPRDTNPDGYTLFYWQAYHPMTSETAAAVEYKESKAAADQHGQSMRKSPYKFKRDLKAADLTNLGDIVEDFLTKVRSGAEPLYYYSEADVKGSVQIHPNVKRLVGDTLEAWFDSIAPEKIVYLVLQQGDLSKIEKVLKEISSGYLQDWDDDSFEIGYIDTSANEIDRRLGSKLIGSAMWVWTESASRSLNTPSARVLGVNSLNSLKQGLMTHRPLNTKVDL